MSAKKPPGHSCCDGFHATTQSQLAALDYPGSEAADRTHRGQRVGLSRTEAAQHDADRTQTGRAINHVDVLKRARRSAPEAAIGARMAKPAGAPPADGTPLPAEEPELTRHLAWQVWNAAVRALTTARNGVLIKHKNWWFKVAKGTAIYDGSGRPTAKRGECGSGRELTITLRLPKANDPRDLQEVTLSTLPQRLLDSAAGYVALHAGNLKSLPLPGSSKLTECVFAWLVRSTAPVERDVSGWIPLNKLRFAKQADKKKLRNTLGLCSHCIEEYQKAGKRLTRGPARAFRFRTCEKMMADFVKLKEKFAPSENGFSTAAHNIASALDALANTSGPDRAAAVQGAKGSLGALIAFLTSFKFVKSALFDRYFRESDGLEQKVKGQLDKLRDAAQQLDQALTGWQTVQAEPGDAPDHASKVQSAEGAIATKTGAVKRALKVFAVPRVNPPTYELAPGSVRANLKKLGDELGISAADLRKAGPGLRSLDARFGMGTNSQYGNKLWHYLPKPDFADNLQMVLRNPSPKSYCNLSANLSRGDERAPLLANDVLPAGHKFFRRKFRKSKKPAGPNGVWGDLFGPWNPVTRAERIGSVLWYYGYCNLRDASGITKHSRWGWVPAIALEGRHSGARGR